jgi:thioredoxin-dependent peroxiredoxin
MIRATRLALTALAFTVTVTSGAWLMAPAAVAALSLGARAPTFGVPGAQGGRRLTINLVQQLRRGPVVIYFFPRAFTSGCTIESRAFAEAVPQFRRAGATVIGLSGDDVETLGRFSTQECRSAFPMGSASSNLMAQYDVVLREGISNRTSYVIARDGTIAHVHNDMNPNDHVRETLAAVQRLTAAQRGRR